MTKKIQKPKNQETELTERLEELCVSIFAHCDNDYRVTLAGNGTNPGEAANVAIAILDILHGDGRKWQDDNEKRISKYAAELRKQRGDED